MAGRLEGLKTVVTGGNTGIGRAVALAYAREGADVTVAWFDRPADAESTVRTIVRAGRQAIAVRADVTDERSVADLFAAHADRFGRLDVLVNNAGIQKSRPVDRMPLADWDRMMAVHLRGAFLCSRAAAQRMKRRRAGRIVNVCSQLGYVGRAGYTAYSAAKAGLIGFTRALAKELAPFGILVNGMAPGLVDTGFDPLSARAKRTHAASLPLRRLGTPDDMTSSFVFLASAESRYFCGQLLHPNGGEIMP
jgi:3-oxoacyl-[acyl-carrier protein] reductase